MELQQKHSQPTRTQPSRRAKRLKADPYLCKRCSQIDFESLSKMKLGVDEFEVVIDFDSKGESQHCLKHTCVLCQFFRNLCQRRNYAVGDEPMRIYMTSSVNLSRYRRFSRRIKRLKSSKAYQKVLAQHHNILVISDSFYMDQYTTNPSTAGMVDLSEGEPIFFSRQGIAHEHLIQARYVNPMIDLSVIKGWIDICRNHKACSLTRLAEVQTIPNFSLLDCQLKKIVPFSNGNQFVALSYVWGGFAQEISNNFSGELPTLLPRTIADAIRVTTLLGFRYIWIDRYCIPADAKVKHQQINAMNSIYQAAEITIVATAGDDCNHGLPGISFRQRLPQPQVAVRGFDLVSSLHYPVNKIMFGSTWYRRGWTYQEAFLSRRCLYFTKDMVYFECAAGSFRETIREPDELYSLCSQYENALDEKDLDRFVIGEAPNILPPCFWEQVRTEPWHILERINEYIYRRSLTVRDDILKAFLGILQEFRHPTCSFSHVWGVPVLWSSQLWTPSHGFVTGLCWMMNHEPMSLRESFPTWSWTGWVNDADDTGMLLGNFNMYQYGAQPPYEIDASFEEMDGTIRSWKSYEQTVLLGRTLELSKYLHIDGWTVQCTLFQDDSDGDIANYARFGSYQNSFVLKVDMNCKLEGYSTHAKDVLIVGNPERARSQLEGEHPWRPLIFLIFLESYGSYHERIGSIDLHWHALTKYGKDFQFRLNVLDFLAGRQRRHFRIG
jgi:hypothetical protein